MRRDPPNLLLVHHEWRGEWPGADRPTRVRLGGAGTSGRYARIGPAQWRHRATAAALEGPGVVCRLVSCPGMARTWERVPARGDALVALGGPRFATWMRMAVIDAAWGDYGRTLEIVARVTDEAPVGADRHDARAARRGVRAIAAAAAMVIGGHAMADFDRAREYAKRVAQHAAAERGTYAELDIDEMQEWLRQLGEFPREVRASALPEAAEAVLSEAQTDAPIRTGFLKDSHTVLDRGEDGITIGVNTAYALAVHETHPSKKRWFTSAVVAHFPRIMERLLRRLAREKGGA